MAMLVTEKVVNYSDVSTALIREGQMVNSWFLMSNPWPIVSIAAAYLVFVLRIGPDMMETRKPYNLKYIMIMYNVYQVLYNATIFLSVFKTDGALSYLMHHTCIPQTANPLRFQLCNVAWYYFFSKLADLADTVFFVLRKKQSHVTFLHVYHHSMMLLTTWAYLKYIRVEQGAIIGLVNAFVHTVMYSYYLLAALGPQIQPFLWWKKYITRLQMVQFVFIIGYTSYLLTFNCNLPREASYYAFFNAAVFLYLFGRFYVNSYLIKSKKH